MNTYSKSFSTLLLGATLSLAAVDPIAAAMNLDEPFNKEVFLQSVRKKADAYAPEERAALLEAAEDPKHRALKIARKHMEDGPKTNEQLAKNFVRVVGEAQRLTNALEFGTVPAAKAAVGGAAVPVSAAELLPPHAIAQREIDDVNTWLSEKNDDVRKLDRPASDLRYMARIVQRTKDRLRDLPEDDPLKIKSYALEKRVQNAERRWINLNIETAMKQWGPDSHLEEKGSNNKSAAAAAGSAAAIGTDAAEMLPATPGGPRAAGGTAAAAQP